MNNNSKKLGQEPAFADPMRAAEQSCNNQNPNGLSVGMSKRLLIAKDMACAMLSNSANYGNTEKVKIVRSAFELTDELLKQEDSDE